MDAPPFVPSLRVHEISDGYEPAPTLKVRQSPSSMMQSLAVPLEPLPKVPVWHEPPSAVHHEYSAPFQPSP